MFVASGEDGAEVYTAATKTDQSKIVWTNIKNLLAKSDINDEINISYHMHNLAIEDTWSKCEPLSRDTKSMDGLDTYCGILDELHAHPTPEIHNLVCDSVGARLDPLILIITTAGFDQLGVCYQRRTYLTKVLKGIVEDDSFFGVIYTLDRKLDWPELKTLDEYQKKPEGTIEDDWEDEDLWIKANPGLIGISKSGTRYGVDESGAPIPGYMTKIEKIREDAKYAKEMPSALNNFLTKRLNIWTQQSERWISMPLWDRNFIEPINEDELKGHICFGGVDLSAVLDLTPWVMAFPNKKDKLRVDVIMRCWCPEARLWAEDNKYRDSYQGWKKEGWLLTTPGNAIDYDFIRAQIMEDAKKFQIDSISVDRLFQGYEFTMKLDREMGGHEKNPKVAACGMGWGSMGVLCLEFEKRLMDCKINHGGNPILRWMADNVAVKRGAGGTVVSPDKATSQGKIDGIVALLLAFDRLMRKMPLGKSIYEKRGLLVL